MTYRKSAWLSIGFWLLCVSAKADVEKIEFSDEELAQESVLPVFSKTSVVKNRLVKTDGRFAAALGLGLNLGEPLYDPLVFNLNLTYHLNEVSAVNVNLIMSQNGLSNMGTDLQEGRGLTGRNFDASRAPSPELFTFLNYQYTGYYGKVSITKQTVMNLMLYGLLGIGTVSFGDSQSVALNAGVGQKFYFTNNFALRFDLSLALYEGPDPTQPNTTDSLLEAGGEKLGSDEFESTLFVRSFLMVNASYLF